MANEAMCSWQPELAFSQETYFLSTLSGGQWKCSLSLAWVSAGEEAGMAAQGVLPPLLSPWVSLESQI